MKKNCKHSQYASGLIKLFSHGSKKDTPNCPSHFNQKSRDWTLNEMTKPVAYHGWVTRKVFDM